MELRDYLRVIQSRKWIIILATVVTLVTAVAVSLASPKIYEAEANLLISESASNSGLLDTALSGFSMQPERGLQTQVRMMQMRPAFERTIRRLDLRMHPADLIAKTEIRAEGQTNVITVIVRDEDPRRAARIANTLAQEYALWVRDFSRNRIRAAADEVEAQLETVRDELIDSGKAAGKNPSDSDRMALQIAGQDYAGLSEQLRQLTIREQMEVGPVQVVNSAAVPSDPVSPKPLRNAALALVVGLTFGLAGAFVLEVLDTTVKTSAEVAEIADAPVLGIIPITKESPEVGIAMAQSGASPVAEAFRGIRNSLDFINFEHSIRSVLITSAAPGEGKSTVASNLAVGLARAGKRVILVSADFHRPRAAAYLRMSETLGLSHVLTGQYALDVCLQQAAEENLQVLASGKVPPNPSELLGSDRMGALLRDLASRAEWVILDGPPVLSVADTTAVAKWVDGSILVVRAGKTDRQALERSVAMLAGVGNRVIGAVLLGVDEGNPAAMAYGYSSYVSKRGQHGAK